MADKKISELNSLTGANAADGDLVAIVDVSATETKKITRSEFFTDTPSIDVGGTVTATGFVTTGDMTFGDNDKAIFGAGSDLQIYHDGSHSRIQDVGAGDLILSAENDLRLETYTGNVPYINCNYADSVQLAFNGDWKLATTSTGIDVTGTVTADGLTVNSASFPTGLIKVKQDSDATRNRGIILEANADDSMLAIGYSNGKFSLAPTYNTSGSFEPLSVFTSNQERLSVDTNGDISFYEDTGTTPKFFWDASAEGLGVGYDPTVATDTALSVSSLTGEVGTNPVQQWKYTNDNNTMLRLRQIVTSGVVKHTFDLKNAGTDYNNNLVLDRGNVGIGTSSPSSVIDARQTSTGASTQIRVYNTDNSNTTTQTAALFLSPDSRGNGALIFAEKENADFSTTAARDISLVFSPVLNNSQTEAMRIDSSGNVGIGNTTSGYVFTAGETRLTVGDGAEHAAIQVYSGTTKWGGIAFSDDAVDVAAQGFIGYYHPDNYMVFNTAGSEAVRIDASGNLLINGTTTVGYKFHLYGDAAFERTGTTSQTMVVFRNGNGNVGTITTSGSSTAYNTSSDYRLKTDAQPMVGASDRVLALKPCNFAWKADGTRVDGFLAHEAQAVVPEAVTGEKDGEEMQAIDHSKLVPLLTAALQEALTEINNLKARVATLEG